MVGVPSLQQILRAELIDEHHWRGASVAWGRTGRPREASVVMSPVIGSSVHLYVIWWVLLAFVAGLVCLVGARQADATSRARQRFRLGAEVLLLAWFFGVLAPFDWAGVALPWANPPPMITHDGVQYGNSHGFGDHRNRPCESLQKITSQGPTQTLKPITSVVPAGHVVSLFGGPEVFHGTTDTSNWLLVKVAADCYLSYPEAV